MAKQRRTFTHEFKVEAVRLITEQGRSVAEVARDRDLSESLLRGWKQALAAEGLTGPSPVTATCITDPTRLKTSDRPRVSAATAGTFA